ncbi:hypothetical protein AWL63_06265 [Sphingomonas panacis]|uniref:Uncharacterized protein n=1 Tax=Sphingomonas panacis TaxID=1560345 RepID=A0A1B3Z878_9SPHN|nr:YdaS family helix-turn-helix protein [Sphingomonas panacis]AOH83636.1 hypothetical protein AWL63_06265 [Sphingomonas panacis]
MTSRYDLSSEEYSSAFKAFEEAVAAAPGQTAFANVCRCTQGNISQLLRAKSLLPERYVLKAEAATGVSRFRLRPDIYPRDHASDLSAGTKRVACDRTPILDRAARG